LYQSNWPALATPDVGIAMATATDVAIQSAGITLMRGDPLMVVAGISVSRVIARKIRQGLLWAFIYNVVGIPACRGRPAQLHGSLEALWRFLR